MISLFRWMKTHAGVLCTVAAGVYALGFGTWYWLHDHARLASWYLHLSPCLYRETAWPQQFFTQGVKAQGNGFCTAAFLLGIGLLWYAWRRIGQKHPDISPARPAPTPASSWHVPAGLAIACLALWGFSHSQTHPAYDEIFSAVHGAGMHPFQAMSYYMLPNNHLLFNTLNSLLPCVDDKVMSGRLWSLTAFLATSQFMWAVLRRYLPQHVALSLTLLLLFAFPTLGFASQARGYSMMLLAGWVSGWALCQYAATEQRRYGRIWVVATVAGYATVPVFLYFHLALSIWALGWSWRQRQWWLAFWKYQLLAAGFTFLFYLPVLCFSGWEALAANKYVRPEAVSWVQFGGQLAGLLPFFMDYGFGGLFAQHKVGLAVVCLAPLALWFSKDKSHRAAAWFYLCLWGCAFVVVWSMKKLPFTRNLVIQYSLGLAMAGYALFALLQKLWPRRPLLAKWIFHVVMLCGLVWFLYRFPQVAGEQLYFNPANPLYAQHRQDAAQLPKDAPIAFSDECFYWYYLCRKAGGQARRCPQGDEGWWVKRAYEPPPDSTSGAFQVAFRSRMEDYVVWKRRE